MDESAQHEARMVESMNQPATTVHAHCLSPARARVAIDAPLGPTAYGRMFPELPSFRADEQFLHALGRAGGVCDCGDVEDSPGPWETQPPAGPSSVSLWPTITRGCDANLLGGERGNPHVAGHGSLAAYCWYL